MEDRSNRLKLLFSMFELNLKRELSHEERRLLALSDRFCGEEPGVQDNDVEAARGKSAS